MVSLNSIEMFKRSTKKDKTKALMSWFEKSSRTLANKHVTMITLSYGGTNEINEHTPFSRLYLGGLLSL